MNIDCDTLLGHKGSGQDAISPGLALRAWRLLYTMTVVAIRPWSVPLDTLRGSTSLVSWTPGSLAAAPTGLGFA